MGARSPLNRLMVLPTVRAGELTRRVSRVRRFSLSRPRRIAIKPSLHPRTPSPRLVYFLPAIPPCIARITSATLFPSFELILALGADVALSDTILPLSHRNSRRTKFACMRYHQSLPLVLPLRLYLPRDPSVIACVLLPRFTYRARTRSLPTPSRTFGLCLSPTRYLLLCKAGQISAISS